MFGFKKAFKKDDKKQENLVEEQASPAYVASEETTAEATVAKEKVNFYVPDFFNNAPLYILLADFIEHIPQWFYDDVKIAAAYGTFPNCIWNGGRVALDSVTREDMDLITNELNKRGIAIRFTFTNPLLEEKHMNDTFSNLCLEATNNGMNEVLVNTQVIEDHIRANYPNFKIISSITKCKKTIEEVEEELKKDYYLVVLDSSLNVDKRIFEIEGRERLEVLVDHTCRINCPRREKHYTEVGKSQLGFTDSTFSCPHAVKTFEELKKSDHFVTREELEQKFIPAGFKHFKLDGRAFPQETLVDSLVYYFVRPQFRAQVKDIIKKEVYGDEAEW